MNNDFDPNNNINNEDDSINTEGNLGETEKEQSSDNRTRYNGYYSSASNGQQGGYTSPYGSSQGGYYGQGQQNSYYRPYNPQNNYYGSPARPGQYYGNGGATAGRPVGGADSKKPKGASKGFVIGMVAIGLVISFLLGTFTSVIISAFMNGGDIDGIAGAGKHDVIIQHVTKDENTPPITEKGDVAYVASIAAKTVVEINTQFVSDNKYYSAAGSGVIISSTDEGSYIITCAHVIDDAKMINVRLSDGTEYEAKEFYFDTETDVGIIKLNVKGLPACTVGDFSKVVLGEKVVAIGNALGTLAGTVTEGVISGFNRDILIDGTVYNLFQTSAAINHGNSGGGIFNTEGQLIGISSAGPADELMAEGIGYAIPINDAIAIVTDLLEKGYVSGRVKLGFQLFEIQTQEDVQAWWKYSRYFTDYGVYIVTAENPSFQEGDLLVAIGAGEESYKITSLTDLKRVLREFEVGQTVTITVSRIVGKDVKLFTYELTLQEKTA